MATEYLNKAKKNKADEFYTQLADIEAEMRHYKEQFRGKVVFCNCDDPFESNFFKYFALNFNFLGLKKLIATCYVDSPVAGEQLSLFDVMTLGEATPLGETTPPDNGRATAKAAYKIEITAVTDENHDGAVDLADVAYLLKNRQNSLTLLAGDGDFRSAECIRLLQEADIVATNPPFSLFREYVAQLVEYKKKFLILGSQNAITYKEVFRLIKDNVLWLGVDNGGTKWFRVPDHYEIQTESRKKVENGIKYFSMGSVYWFTNLDHSKRHESITLYQQYTPEAYPRYDNYDAIEVAKTADIPYDYEGAMGVPITFLDRYNPEQFEILGITKTWFGGASKIYPNQIQVNADGSQSVVSKLNDGATIRVDTPPQGKTYYIVGDDYYIQLYARILIKRKGAAQ